MLYQIVTSCNLYKLHIQKAIDRALSPLTRVREISGRRNPPPFRVAPILIRSDIG